MEPQRTSSDPTLAPDAPDTARAARWRARAWRLAVGLGATAALASLVALGLALFLVDADRIAEAVARRASERLGRPVSIGAIEARLFPGPGVNLTDVRVRAARPEDFALEAERIRLRISLPGLFLGRVVLRSVDLDAPRLRLGRDADGSLVPPTLSAGSTAVDARSNRMSGTAGASDDGPRWLVTTLRIRDGVVEAGAQRVEELALEGRVHLDGRADVELRGALAGVGALGSGHLEIADLRARPLAWSGVLELEGVDLTRLRDLGAPSWDAELEGEGHARLQLAGDGSTLLRATLEATAPALRIRDGTRELRGRAQLDATLGESWQLDLSDTQLTLDAPVSATSATSATKPRGIVLRLGGPLPVDPRALAAEGPRRFSLELGQSRLTGEADLLGRARFVSLSGDIDLADLARWGTGRTEDADEPSFPPRPTSGRLRIDALTFAPPMPLLGTGRLEDASLPIDTDLDPADLDPEELGPEELGPEDRPSDRSIVLNGPVTLEGTVIGSPRLIARTHGESFQASGELDLATGILDGVVAVTEGIELASLLPRLGTVATITGLAYGRLELSGPLAEPRSLRGRGEIEVLNGAMPQLSLERIAQARVRPARQERYGFDRLFAAFELRDDGLELLELRLDEEAASAELRGSLTLPDARVDLAGEAYFYRPENRPEDGPEIVAVPFELAGPLESVKATVGRVRTPEEQASRREGRRALLEGMLETLTDQPLPRDPERARMWREQIERVEQRLRDADGENV